MSCNSERSALEAGESHAEVGIQTESCSEEDATADYKTPYTMEEDQTLIDYFIKNQWHHKIGGIEPYQKMVDEKLFKNRSAKSLRSRFQKIVKNLHNYEMSEESKQKFLERRATNKFKVKQQEKNWMKKYST